MKPFSAYRQPIAILTVSCACILISNVAAHPTDTTTPSLSAVTSTTRSTNVATTEREQRETKPLTRYEQGLEDYNEEMAYTDDEESEDNSFKVLVSAITKNSTKSGRQGRARAVAEPRIGIEAGAFGGYYDFLINEGSYKFWAVFQLATALLLIYSTLAALYYAKANPIQADYDYGDYGFFKRSLNGRTDSQSSWFGLSAETYQLIMDAVTRKKYT